MPSNVFASRVTGKLDFSSDDELLIANGEPLVIIGFLIANNSITDGLITEIRDNEDNVIIRHRVGARMSPIRAGRFLADKGFKIVAISGPTATMSATVFYRHPGD